MQRYTMDSWVQECPRCGFVSQKITDRTAVTSDFLKSEAYRTCEGLNFKSDLAALFYRHYMISLKTADAEKTYHAILHAAWACDDADDTENARRCRELALPQLERMIRSEPPNRKSLLVVKSDLLRRSGHFEELISEYKDVRFSDPLLDKILAFEIEKASQQDANCYTVSDVPTE